MKNILLIKIFGSLPVWSVLLVLAFAVSTIVTAQLAVFNGVSPINQGDNGFSQHADKEQPTKQTKKSGEGEGHGDDSTDQPQDTTVISNRDSAGNSNEHSSQTIDQANIGQSVQSVDQTSDSEGAASNGSGSGNGETGTNDSSGASGSDGPEDPPPNNPPVNSPPSAPTNATITYYDHDTVIVRANRSTDSDGILRHELLRNGIVVATSASTASPIFITDSSPVVGQTYTYSVRAVDTLNLTGPGSNGATVTIPHQDVTPPSLPANFRVVQNVPGSVTFAWDASTDDQTSQGNIWYVLTSPLNESDFYTWTRINPHQTYWFDEPGLTHDVYIQAIDEANNMTAKVGPITFTAQ